MLNLLRSRLRGLSSKRGLTINSEESYESRNSIVLFPTNGVGFGHFTRMLALAKSIRKISPDTEIVFFTTMPTLFSFNNIFVAIYCVIYFINYFHYNPFIILIGIKYPAVYTEYRLQAITPYYCSTEPTFTAGVAGTFPSSVSVVVSLTSVSCLIPLL